RHTRSKRDWSSDVCSSDLIFRFDEIVSCDVDEVGDHNSTTGIYLRITTSDINYSSVQIPVVSAHTISRVKYNKEGFVHNAAMAEIGRASCRERSYRELVKE